MKTKKFVLYSKIFLGGILSSFSFCFVSVSAQTDPVPKNLKVTTRVIAPFVIQNEDKLTGFSIDLWDNIAKELKSESQFKITGNMPDLLKSVKSGESDLGIAAISITAERYKQFEFSQPIFESGLQILVRSEAQTVNPIQTFASILFAPTMLQLIGAILLLVLIPAHLVWLVERRHHGDFIENKEYKGYFSGVLKSAWWAAGTLATQADEMPKSFIGRVIALIWMFCGALFIAYFTATVTTSMTVQQLQGNIDGPEDLPGKLVATLKGSTSAKYLKEHNVKVMELGKIDAAYLALLNKQVDAVVMDAPVLLYYAAYEGKGKVEVVGNVFQKENYGIVFPINSPYRKRINEILLSLREKGVYEDLYDKWFTTN